MANILLALDATNPDMNALDFACYLAKSTHGTLKVISVKNEHASTVPVVALWPYLKNTANARSSVPVKSDPVEPSCNNCGQPFSDACQNRGVNATIDCNEETGFYDIVAMTRFADLLIVGSGTSLNNSVPDSLSGFVKNLLRQAECPVIIPPARFERIDRIVFAYNGSKSSVFAIKQFTYLFPQLSHIPVTVLEINKHYDLKITERNNMRDWLQKHYPKVEFEVLNGSAPFTLFRYFLGKENMLLVIGSFGRTILSEAFKPGAATKVLKYIDVPVFITHH